MKMLALMFVAIALAEGKGSGPYLPSGWRPEGPAFFLPSEILKPSASPSPAIDLNLQGSEASGSDFLREYGPPKVQEISQNLLNQGLPDVTIEQTFGVSAETGTSQDVAEEVVEVSEVKPEAVSTESPTTASQSSIDDNPPISAELPILDFVVTETTTIPNIEQATEISTTNQQTQEPNLLSQNQESQEAITVQSNQKNSQYVSEQTISQTTEVAIANQQNTQESATVQTNQQESARSLQESSSLESQQESSTVSDLEKAITPTVDSIGNTEVLLVNIPTIYDQNAPELQNIPDIIAGLEKEILTEQAEVKQAVSEIPSGQLPEGFLEYGPPGFAEYGPPKEEKSENLQAIETNETRRRRFSPRIRFGKN